MTKDRVLRYVNQLRVKYGVGEPLDELPKGKRKNSLCCPVARSVNGWAITTDIRVGIPQGEVVVVPPKYVAEFIEAFDNGHYPELIEQAVI